MIQLNRLLESVYVFAPSEEFVKAAADALAKKDLEIAFFEKSADLLTASVSRRPFLVIFCAELDDIIPSIQAVSEGLPRVPMALLVEAGKLEWAQSMVTMGNLEIFGRNSYDSFHNRIDVIIAERIDARRVEDEEIVFLTKVFTEEALELLRDIEPLIMKLEDPTHDSKLIDLIYRKIHTLKGSSGVTPKAKLIGKVCHEFESTLNGVKSGAIHTGQKEVNLFLSCTDLVRKLSEILRDDASIPEPLNLQADNLVSALIALREDLHLREPREPAATSPTKVVENIETSSSDDDGVFVANSRLDDFVRLSGEFIIYKNYFDIFCRESAQQKNPLQNKLALKEFSQNINRLTGRLQDEIMEVRKVVLSRAFSKLPRMVRQTCQDLGKQAKLVQDGLDLGVDKSIAKALSGAMTHMVRNSLDHGMETAAERIQLGKPSEGTVHLIASESGGFVTVVLRDNGRGVNRKKVLAKAVSQKLVTAEAGGKLCDEDIFNLLFLPGFSTADTVTDVSGRGVGMDVVRATVTDLNGKISIQSKEGEGTEIKIEIPIPKTVVIEKTIVVESGSYLFAIPIGAIAKIDTIKSFNLTHIGHKMSCQFEGETIPVGRYGDFSHTLSRTETRQEPFDSMIVLQYKSQRIGLLVNAVKSQLEAVVRPFDGIVQRVYGCKGTTVVGANRIAFVLSPEDFVGSVGNSFTATDVAS